MIPCGARASGNASIDLAKKSAEDTGVALEPVPTSWPHIIDDLLDVGSL
jgi:hypothetical protein